MKVPKLRLRTRLVLRDRAMLECLYGSGPRWSWTAHAATTARSGKPVLGLLAGGLR
jgi:site-specific recombinase XerD